MGRVLAGGLLLAASTISAAFECPTLKVHAPRAAVSIARSLLWQITAPSKPRNYLFGTIHLAADKVGQPNSAVTTALLASKQFGMEMVLDLDTMLRIADAMHYHGHESLRAAAGESLFTETVRLLAAYGVDAEAANSLKPWAAYTTLSLPPGESSTPLDLVLLGTAQHAKKMIFGLETLAEQVGIFDTLAPTEQVALLTEAVCHHAQLQADTTLLIEQYRQQDLVGIYQTANKYDSKIQQRLTQTLLHDRNQRMAERMEPHLREGGAFIAIGALHLPGADGVLALLVARGYQVRALP